MRLRPLAIIAPLLLVTANFPAAPANAVPPLVGFSFSANVLPAGEDPAAALASLLRQLNPDLVRLPGMIQVTLEKTGQSSLGSLMLTFADRPLQLIAVGPGDPQTLRRRLPALQPAAQDPVAQLQRRQLQFPAEIGEPPLART